MLCNKDVRGSRVGREGDVWSVYGEYSVSNVRVGVGVGVRVGVGVGVGVREGSSDGGCGYEIASGLVRMASVRGRVVGPRTS